MLEYRDLLGLEPTQVPNPLINVVSIPLGQVSRPVDRTCGTPAPQRFLFPQACPATAYTRTLGFPFGQVQELLLVKLDIVEVWALVLLVAVLSPAVEVDEEQVGETGCSAADNGDLGRTVERGILGTKGLEG
jgi:hypothetical protein